jgi:lauroyl/myristoyl acyltransferase
MRPETRAATAQLWRRWQFPTDEETVYTAIVRMIDGILRTCPRPIRTPALHAAIGLAAGTWARSFYTRTAHRIETLLGESPAESRRIARRRSYESALFRTRFHALTEGDDAAVDAAVTSTVVEDGDDFRAYHLRHPRALVFLSIHMGSYLTGLLALRRYQRQVQAYALRRAKASEEESAAYSHFARYGGQIQFLRHENNSSLAAVKALRSGCSLFAFLDLPQQYGLTERLTVFDLPMYWVRGPVELAIIGRATIIPYVVFRRGPVDVLQFHEPIDTKLRGGESLLTATSRLCQRLARICEGWIRAHPEQWWHWGLVPAMLQPPDGATGDEREGAEIG